MANKTDRAIPLDPVPFGPQDVSLQSYSQYFADTEDHAFLQEARELEGLPPAEPIPSPALAFAQSTLPAPVPPPATDIPASPPPDQQLPPAVSPPGAPSDQDVPPATPPPGLLPEAVPPTDGEPQIQQQAVALPDPGPVTHGLPGPPGFKEPFTPDGNGPPDGGPIREVPRGLFVKPPSGPELAVRFKPIEQKIIEATIQGIAGAVIEGPPAIAKGAVRFADSFIDNFNALFDFIIPIRPLLGTPAIDPKTGEISFLSGAEFRKLEASGKLGKEIQKLTGIGDKRSVTAAGQAIEEITQFSLGFFPAAKAIRGGVATIEGLKVIASLLVKGPKKARTFFNALKKQAPAAADDLVAAFMADAFAFQPDDERVSTAIQENFPSLAPFVPDFLALKDLDDTRAEKQLKRGLEGLGLGLLIEPIARSFIAMRAVGKARKEVGPQLEALAAKEGVPAAAVDPVIQIGGDPAGPKITITVTTPTGLSTKISPAVTRAAKKLVEGTEAVKDVQPIDIAPTLPGAGDIPAEFKINVNTISDQNDIVDLFNSVRDAKLKGQTAIKEAIAPIKRGPVSRETTAKEAAKLAKNVPEILTDFIGREPGQNFRTAAEAQLAIDVLNQLFKQIDELSVEVAKPLSGPVDQIMLHRSLATFKAISDFTGGGFSEIGRTLNVAKAMNVPPALRGDAIEKFLADTGGSQDIRNVAALIQTSIKEGMSPSVIGKLGEYSGMQKFFRGATKSLTTVFHNAMLSNPVTLGNNAVWGGAMMLWRPAIEYSTAIIERTFKGNETAFDEANAFMFGMLHSFRDGLRVAVYDKKSPLFKEISPFLQDKFEGFAAQDFVGGLRDLTGNPQILNYDYIARGLDVVGALSTLATEGLRRTDNGFRTIIARAEQHKFALQQANATGVTDPAAKAKILADVIENPPKEFLTDAVHRTDKSFLTNTPNPVAQGVMEFTRLGDKGIARATGIELPVFSLLNPYIKVGANIFDFTFENSPFGFLYRDMRNDLAAGGPRASSAAARMGFGAMAMSTFAYYEAQGFLTGQLDPDHDAAFQKRTSGLSPNSILFNDKWVSYDGFDPISSFAKLAAEMNMALRFATAEDVATQELAGAAVLMLAKNLTQQSYFDGMINFMAAMDPTNNRRTLLAETLKLGDNFVPYAGFTRWWNQQMNPQLKELAPVRPTDVEGVRSSFMGEMQERAVRMSRASLAGPMAVYARRGPLGRILKDDRPWQERGLQHSFLSDNPNEADPILSRFTADGVVVRRLEDRIKNVPLTGSWMDQYQEIFRKLGIEGDRGWKALQNGNQYKNATPGPDGAKQIMVDRLRTKLSQQAAEMLQDDNPTLRGLILENLRLKTEALSGKSSPQLNQMIEQLEQETGINFGGQQ